MFLSGKLLYCVEIFFSSVKNEDGANSGEAQTSTSTQGDTASHTSQQTM